MLKGLLGKLGLTALIGLSGCAKDPEVRELKPVTPSFSRVYGATAAGIAAADFNGDGIMDLAVGDLNGVDIYRGLGNGNINFVYASSLNNVRNSSLSKGGSGIGSADIDKDGKMDLVVGDISSLIRVYKGVGDLKFVEGPQIIFQKGLRDSFDGACGIECADFGESNLKLIVGGLRNGTSIYEIDKGIATFESSLPGVLNSRYNRDGCSGVAFIPGRPGKIVASNKFGVEVFRLNDYSIESHPELSSIGLKGPLGLAAADFNGDGKSDLIVAGDLGNNNQGIGVMIDNGDKFDPLLELKLNKN